MTSFIDIQRSIKAIDYKWFLIVVNHYEFYDVHLNPGNLWGTFWGIILALKKIPQKGGHNVSYGFKMSSGKT
jgi:hypothetical protein